MEYPRFKLHIAAYDLIEHFTLTSDERYLLSQWRKDTNCLGFAVLIKSFQFLGYPPRQKENIPDAIISCISCQLKLDVKLFNEYRWKDSVWKAHSLVAGDVSIEGTTIASAYRRVDRSNRWESVEPSDLRGTVYGRPFRNANGLAVAEVSPTTES